MLCRECSRPPVLSDSVSEHLILSAMRFLSEQLIQSREFPVVNVHQFRPRVGKALALTVDAAEAAQRCWGRVYPCRAHVGKGLAPTVDATEAAVAKPWR